MAEIVTAVASTVVSDAASKAAEPLLAWVCRQCGYVMFTDRYVGQLEDELQNLNNARQRVRHSVDYAGHNMKPTEADVENWVKKAETVAQKAGDVLAHKARDVLDDEGRAKKTCFCGWLLNPKARYCLGRDASKTVEAILELIRQGKFDKVYYENDPPALVGGASGVNSSASNGGHTIQAPIAGGQFEKVDFKNPPTVLVGGASGVNSSAGEGGDFITGSRASIFQDIMKALNEVEKPKVIGVYGPGGVGKTTLLKEVEKKLREAGRPFRMIVKVEVPQNRDLNNIIDQIADALSLDLKDKRSPQGKADVLSKRLKSNPDEKVLIIFDNLWVKLDLEAVGIPWGDVSSKCKLLLTSRFKDVLGQEMGADQTFLLQGLKDDEAFRLFENKVGDKLKGNEGSKSIADQVVKKLAGLPLLIISVATTLKSSDESAWRNALIDIDDSNKEKKETIVRLSYDHLKSKDAKYLFLLCGLIGGTIRVELLFVLAMGLGLFERFNKTMQDSRDRLNEMLNDLRSACLLLDGGDEKDKVTIHDLYSEVVVSTPFRDQNSLMMNNNNYLWSKEKLEKCWAICLEDVRSDRLAELMLCQFPILKILMLSKPTFWGRMHPHLRDVDDGLGPLDFTEMKELRVLYLCSMHITNLPPSIEILRNLRSLYLYSCNVKNVSIIGKLKALQILSFKRSTISTLPEEMGELTNLRLLNLSGCYGLRIKLGVLQCLIKLEELNMKTNFVQWMDKNEKPLELCNAGLVELRNMIKLNSLKIEIYDPIELLEVDDLPFENLTRFWINIGYVYGREFKGLRTMKIKLKGHDSILSKKWVRKILQKSQYFCLDGLKEFENVHELCMRGFPQLKHLDIQNSPSIKYIVSSPNSAFAILESLFLNDLINLKKISHGHIVTECFSKLKYVRVEYCNQLEYLWSLSHMQNLLQLENISVRDCNLMRAIARKDTVPADCKVELPYLRCLDLVWSPNMNSFCTGAEIASEGAPIQARVVDGGGGGDEGTESGITISDLQNTYSDSFFDGKISLPNLEHLQLCSMGSFKRIWHDELSRSSFCKLATITIQHCSDLLHIFPSTIIGGLTSLQSVMVFNCPSLKSLFDFGSLDSNTEQTVVLLPELVSINIESCPSLESLFNCGSLDSNAEHKIILLPKLEKVRVSGAKKLRHIVMSHSQIVLGFPSLNIVIVEDCSDLRYLFSKYMATTLMKLELLKISKCEQMKEVILEKEAGRLEAKVMSFPCLSTLILEKLDNFFSSGSVERQLGEITEENDESPQPLFNEMVMVTFPNITSLEINGLQCKELWNNNVRANSIVCSQRFLLKNVKVENCPSLKSLFNFGSLDSYTEQNVVLFPKLVSIDVKSCPSLESLFSCGSLDSNVEHKIILFPKLEQVRVSRAKKLRHVLTSHYQMVLDFPRLNTITVENCSDLRYLFPRYMATTLMKLKWLEISRCEQMKEVILEKEAGRLEAEVMSFPYLSTLILEELDNLIAFGSRSVERQLGETAEENDELPQPLFNEMVTFPNITSLEIYGLQCKELWNNQIPTNSFQKLESLKLKNCDNLQCIATPYMWKKLQHCLKKLEVISCHLIKIIYEGDGTDTESAKLRWLDLDDLKNLRCIWQSDSLPNILFPYLRDVKVVRCPRLKMLFPTFTTKFLGQIKGLVVESCENMELIAGHDKWEEVTGTTITLSELTDLRLFNLPEFKSFLPEKYSLKLSCFEHFPSLQDLCIVSCGAEPGQVLTDSSDHKNFGVFPLDVMT